MTALVILCRGDIGACQPNKCIAAPDAHGCVLVPDTVTTIVDNAFAGCEDRVLSIVISDTVVILGHGDV